VTAVGPGRRVASLTLGAMLAMLYLFLYVPVGYIVYVSFQENPIFPFPPAFTTVHYVNMLDRGDFHQGLVNSVLIGAGTGSLSVLLAAAAAVGILKYRFRSGRILLVAFLTPLFVAHVLIGVSSLLFYRSALQLPGNMWSAVLANTTYGFAFAFLVVLAQLTRYDWRIDDVATVFGASPVRTFREVTLPIVWPALLGAFLVTFILAFNNLEVTFYNIGAIPTLPTLAWGSLRHGVKPELYAMAAAINIVVLAVLAVLYVLLKRRVIRLGPE
jgi:ABC-type spermidine/putrescine transport system permease subunit II